MTARGLGLREKARLITITAQLQAGDWQLETGLTVAQWLRRGKQSAHAIRGFWQPLCLRSEEHTSELQSLMRISYAVFCLKKNKHNNETTRTCTAAHQPCQNANTPFHTVDTKHKTHYPHPVKKRYT